MKPGMLAGLIFALGLLMIWKSNKVKDYYSRTKNLENSKSELTAEIAEYKAELMDLKSIIHVGHVAKKYGLTQDVAERITIEIPEIKDIHRNKELFVDMDRFAEWLEDAVFKSGRINARE